MELQTLKGTKDYLPDEQIVREKIRDVLVKKFKLYGFNPLETPILQMFDVLSSKYAGGAEILKEVYTLKDQGDRDLALRYDLTIPLTKVVGLNPNLRMPFKRYEIGKVFRNGPVKAGRLREFTQCDVDTFGASSLLAEAELMAMVFDVFDELNLEVYVEVNNRKMLSGIIENAGISPNLVNDVILSVDKLKKIGAAGVKQELEGKNIDPICYDKLFRSIDVSGTYEDILSKIEKLGSNTLMLEGAKELRELFGYLKCYKIKKDIKLVPSLARGLEIYTGTVFEVFMKEGEVTSSIAAGGRYDKIVGQFLGGTKDYPAVGITFGLDVIFEVLRQRGAAEYASVVQAFVIPIKQNEKSVEMVAKLRKAGICSDMDLRGRNIGKNMEYADNEKIPYVILIGEDEVKKNVVKLRDMKTGKEKEVSPTKAISEIKKGLKKKN